MLPGSRSARRSCDDRRAQPDLSAWAREFNEARPHQKRVGKGGSVAIDRKNPVGDRAD